MSTDFALWDIPNNWSWAAFHEVAEIVQNLVSPESVANVPHIAPNNIEAGTRVLLPYGTVRDDGVISPKNRFFEGQIIFSKIRPYLLKSILATFDGVCSADMYPINARPSADKKYLLYWLTSPDFRNAIAFNQGRTVLPKINQTELNASRLPIPPIMEQHRISAKIDRLIAHSRQAHKEIDSVISHSEIYKAEVLRKAFAGTGHNSTILDDFVSEGLIGLVRSKDQQSDIKGVRYIRMQHFDISGSWDFTSLTQVDTTSSELMRYRLRKGDILFNTRNSLELVGKVAIWPGSELDHVYNNNLLRLRFDDRVEPEFAFLQLRSPAFRSKMQLLKSSTTSVAAIYQKPLMKLPFWVPALAEQREIVGQVERAFAAIDQLAAETHSARNALSKLDQAILAKAFRGELVPQDPNDEPASVLLDRIRAEHAAAGPSPRRGRRPRGMGA